MFKLKLKDAKRQWTEAEFLGVIGTSLKSFPPSFSKSPLLRLELVMQDNMQKKVDRKQNRWAWEAGRRTPDNRGQRLCNEQRQDRQHKMGQDSEKKKVYTDCKTGQGFAMNRWGRTASRRGRTAGRRGRAAGKEAWQLAEEAGQLAEEAGHRTARRSVLANC